MKYGFDEIVFSIAYLRPVKFLRPRDVFLMFDNDSKDKADKDEESASNDESVIVMISGDKHGCRSVSTGMPRGPWRG